MVRICHKPVTRKLWKRSVPRPSQSPSRFSDVSAKIKWRTPHPPWSLHLPRQRRNSTGGRPPHHSSLIPQGKDFYLFLFIYASINFCIFTAKGMEMMSVDMDLSDLSLILYLCWNMYPFLFCLWRLELLMLFLLVFVYSIIMRPFMWQWF
jgi:hypothetical protein